MMVVMMQRLDSPIFIGGAGSSGSSLVAAMLRRHSDVYCAPEISLFNKSPIFDDFDTVKRKLPKWLKSGLPTDGYYLYFKLLPRADEDLIKPDVLLRCAAESKTTRQFIDAVQAYCLQQSGRQLFAEKTPSNSYCFRQLATLYPNCLLIHPIRDGRDVVCSLMRRGFSIFSAASSWLYNTACAYSCRDLPNYFEYKYEDLVTEPAAVLQRICERASIPYEPRMMEPQEGDLRGALQGIWKSIPTAPIGQQSVGRYRVELSGADYALFCSVQLTKLGARQAGTEQYSALQLLELLGYRAQPPSQRPHWLRAKSLEAHDHLRRAQLLVRWGHLPRRALTKVRR